MITISNSEIQTFKDCRRRWYVLYYLGKQPGVQPITGATNLGTKVHAALEGYYNPVIKLSPREAMHALNMMYALDMGVRPEATEALEKERELGAAMISGYFEWLEETGADQYLKVLSVEREIVVPITEDVSLRGRLDMIVSDTHAGSKLFLDHKTCIQWLTTDYLDRDEQSKFYMMLQRLSKEDKDLWCDGGIFNMLRKVKRGPKAVPPFYKRETIRHNADTLNSMYKRTYQTVTEIVDMRADLDKGIDPQQMVYPHPTRDCVWKCPLAAGLCGMMDDGSDWKGYLESEWVDVDPYARYTESSYIDRLDQEGLL
jgi:hypothetical protein